MVVIAILYANGQPASSDDPAVQQAVNQQQYTRNGAGDFVLNVNASGPYTTATTAAIAPNNPAALQYQAQQNVFGAQQNQIGAQQEVYAAQLAVIPQQQAQIGAQRAANAAQGNVYAAQQNTIPLSAAEIAARNAVIDAQAAQTQAQIGFIGQQQQANTAKTADEAAIVNARNNVADQVGVARWQQDQNDLNRYYQAGGQQSPIRINVSPDQQGGNVLAPGVIANVRTQEEKLIDLASIRQAQRNGQLEAARLAVELQGTSVNQADQAARRAGLTLEQANLLVKSAQIAAGQAGLAANNAGLNVEQARLGVDQAQIAAGQAGLGVSQARLNQDIAGTPPLGMVEYRDPNTGAISYVTQGQADQAKADYQRNFQQAQRVQQNMQQQGNPLANFSQAEIGSLLADGMIPPEMAKAELVRRYNAGESGGLSPQAADLYIAGVQAGAKQGGTKIVIPGEGGAGGASSGTSSSAQGAAAVQSDAETALRNRQIAAANEMSLMSAGLGP